MNILVGKQGKLANDSRVNGIQTTPRCYDPHCEGEKREVLNG